MTAPALAEPLIDLSLDKAKQVIALTDAYKAYITKTLGAEPAAEAVEKDVAAGTAAEAKALFAAIDGLSRQERAELVGLIGTAWTNTRRSWRPAPSPSPRRTPESPNIWPKRF